jgi:hypothetical protein
MPDIFNAVELRRRRLREKLFPSYPPKTEGKFIAKTLNEAMLTMRGNAPGQDGN